MSELLRLAQSNSQSKRDNFVRLGADVTEPGYVLMFNESLGAEMYNKIILTQEGECLWTTNPAFIILMTDKWRVWTLGHEKLYIGYTPDARKPNLWWDKLRVTLGPLAKRVPRMYGRLVVFRPYHNLLCNEKELRRELINFAVTRFRMHQAYNFSWEKV